jgi:hypothetical protein
MEELANKRVLGWGIVALSAILFIAALFFPAIYYRLSEAKPTPNLPLHYFFSGFDVMLTGIFGGYIEWFANPCLFLAWLGLVRSKYAYKTGAIMGFIMSLLALALALKTFNLMNIIVNESGSREPVAGFGQGFYLWLGSILVALFGSLVLIFLSIRDT